jgi:hypothetical protein
MPKQLSIQFIQWILKSLPPSHWSKRSVTVTINLHLTLKLRIGGAVRPPPHSYVFIFAIPRAAFRSADEVKFGTWSHFVCLAGARTQTHTHTPTTGLSEVCCWAENCQNNTTVTCIRSLKQTPSQAVTANTCRVQSTTLTVTLTKCTIYIMLCNMSVLITTVLLFLCFHSCCFLLCVSTFLHPLMLVKSINLLCDLTALLLHFLLSNCCFVYLYFSYILTGKSSVFIFSPHVAKISKTTKRILLSESFLMYFQHELCIR